VAGSIEAIAAGELALALPGAPEHVRTCQSCQGRVALARRLESLLAAAPVAVPEHFVVAVVRRVRDENRRRERLVDLVFNASIAAGVVAALTLLALLVQWTGLSALIANVLSLAGQGVRAASGTTIDSVLYVGGSLAGLTAFLMWRWSEGERFL
jgi:hypothetical protein